MAVDSRLGWDDDSDVTRKFRNVGTPIHFLFRPHLPFDKTKTLCRAKMSFAKAFVALQVATLCLLNSLSVSSVEYPVDVELSLVTTDELTVKFADGSKIRFTKTSSVRKLQLAKTDCIFSGHDVTNPENFILFSQCKHLNGG